MDKKKLARKVLTPISIFSSFDVFLINFFANLISLIPTSKTNNAVIILIPNDANNSNKNSIIFSTLIFFSPFFSYEFMYKRTNCQLSKFCIKYALKIQISYTFRYCLFYHSAIIMSIYKKCRSNILLNGKNII